MGKEKEKLFGELKNLMSFDELIREAGAEEQLKNRLNEKLLRQFLGQALINEGNVPELLYIDPSACKVGKLIDGLPYSTQVMSNDAISGLIKKVKELSGLNESRSLGIFYVDRVNTGKFNGFNYDALVEIKESSKSGYRIEVRDVDFLNHPCKIIELVINKVFGQAG